MHRRDFLFDGAAICVALAVRFASPPASWIETHYSNVAYPIVDRSVRALTAPLPFCVGDALFAIALAWLFRYWVVTLCSGGYGLAARAARAGLRTLSVACLLFVWFMGSWALNYARVPLTDKIPVHTERTDEDSVAAFADHVVDMLSRHARGAHLERVSDAGLGPRLIPAFEATIRRLGDAEPFPPPRVKPTIFQTTLQLSATTGFTDPWTHEVNLDAAALPVERPAIYAHEWAHIAGFADEAEANFISAIACTTSRDPLLQYSGWILIWENLPSGVRITHHLSPLAYADLAAIRARFVKNVNPHVQHASQVAYDHYLKSNHVKAGYGSYRIFIRWMTGADFDRNGLPIARVSAT